MQYLSAVGKKKQKHPILFLHGAYCDSQVWKEHFLEYFSNEGFDCYLLDFQNQENMFNMQQTKLCDYVDQVLKAINEIGELPIVVGHSMGCAVMQKLYQEKKLKFPAWVMMTPAPPRNFYESSQEMLLNNPQLFSQMYMLQMMGSAFVSPSIAKLALFSDDFDEKLAFKYFSKVKPMPPSLVFDIMTLNISDEDLQVDFPVLIQEAKQDRLISSKNMKMTQKTFNTKSKIYNSGHAIMLDKEWEKSAADIVKFATKLK
jgi:pimeloyl-ACP methyl ester carboxylesterase